MFSNGTSRRPRPGAVFSPTEHCAARARQARAASPFAAPGAFSCPNPAPWPQCGSFRQVIVPASYSYRQENRVYFPTLQPLGRKLSTGRTVSPVPSLILGSNRAGSLPPSLPKGASLDTRLAPLLGMRVERDWRRYSGGGLVVPPPTLILSSRETAYRRTACAPIPARLSGLRRRRSRPGSAFPSARRWARRRGA